MLAAAAAGSFCCLGGLSAIVDLKCCKCLNALEAYCLQLTRQTMGQNNCEGVECGQVFFSKNLKLLMVPQLLLQRVRVLRYLIQSAKLIAKYFVSITVWGLLGIDHEKVVAKCFLNLSNSFTDEDHSKA